MDNFPEDKSITLGELADKVFGPVRAFLTKGRKPDACPWTPLDILAFSILVYVIIFNDPFNLGTGILRFLRLHVPLVTREPKLLYYLTIYADTIILKCLSMFFLVVLVGTREASLSGTILSKGKIPRSWWSVWMPLFIGACIIIRVMNLSNPLVPNIPFNSVFWEAKVLGNIVIIFSVLFVAPVIEETVFRGFLYPAINRYAGIYPSVLITSALFTVAHYPQIKEDMLFMSTLFVLSVIITTARARTGSTRLAVIMHFVYNFVSIAVGGVEYLAMRY